ncbi:Uncharacterised protein [Yersinia kristensenii]|nr:Uncharacterised protein [Yersinia kristensenii]
MMLFFPKGHVPFLFSSFLNDHSIIGGVYYAVCYLSVGPDNFFFNDG